MSIQENFLEFLNKHRSKINDDPEMRKQFEELAVALPEEYVKNLLLGALVNEFHQKKGTELFNMVLLVREIDQTKQAMKQKEAENFLEANQESVEEEEEQLSSEEQELEQYQKMMEKLKQEMEILQAMQKNVKGKKKTNKKVQKKEEVSTNKLPERLSMKIEPFSGKSYSEWITFLSRFRNFLHLNKVEDNKLQLQVLHTSIKSNALSSVYNIFMLENPDVTLEEMIQHLGDTLFPGALEEMQQSFLDMRQGREMGVVDFYLLFMEMSSTLRLAVGYPTKRELGALFVSKLRENLKMEIKRQRSDMSSLSEVYSAAVRAEEYEQKRALQRAKMESRRTERNGRRTSVNWMDEYEDKEMESKEEVEEVLNVQHAREIRTPWFPPHFTQEMKDKLIQIAAEKGLHVNSMCWRCGAADHVPRTCLNKLKVLP